ncbi:recombinase family protein [Arthrobacter oryzae]|uniref:Recombinase family protein n=1 Tax=Arthrobacter oryzae TaxID=409290 RepID=A0A3N0BVD7_9MICC|nr:recombinase family protein [Arthrobacter oryzae]RNL52745.1 recombinase family protein [Arthrobacter oryzae]
MELSAYVRISQDKTGESVGVDNQRAAILKWCETNGHTVTEFYEDNDISATSGKRRPDFERLLEDAPKAIVVWTQDRLLRVTKDLERVLDTGMTVHQVNAGDLDLATPQGQAIARTVTAWATYEVEQKADRQKLKNAASAAKGEHYWREGIRPFGHNMDGTLHPEEAPALVAVIDRIIDGAAVTTACRALNEAGLKTNRGKDWHSTSLRRILTNKRIAGIRVHRVYKEVPDKDNPGHKVKELVSEQEYPGAWKEIISADKFRTLGLTLTGRERPRKAKSRENLLTGIATCGLTVYDNYVMVGRECGGTVGQSRSNRGIASYRCSEFKHNSKNADLTEEVVIDRVLLLITVQGAESVLNNRPDIDIAGLRSKRVEKVSAWSGELLAARAAGVSLADTAVYRKAHEAELAAIDAEIFQYEKSSLFSDLWSKFTYFSPETLPEARRIWDALPLERKQRIVTTLFSEVVLMPGSRGARFDPQTVVTEYSPVATQLQMMLNQHGREEIEAGRVVMSGLGQTVQH